jgi:hypothetical protein
MTRTIPAPSLSLLLFLTLALLSGCATTPSRGFQQQVGPPIPFQDLLEKG